LKSTDLAPDGQCGISFPMQLLLSQYSPTEMAWKVGVAETVALALVACGLAYLFRKRR
jgi:hypothetical protein